MRSLLGPLLAVLMVGTGCAATTDEVTIVYSGSLRGELEPCGCTREGDLGGIRRQATAVERIRDERPSALLISAGGLLSTDLPTHRLTSEFIIRGYAELGYDAVGVQWGDLAYGTDFLARGSLPLVASNWLGEELASVLKVAGDGRHLAYFQWLVPDESPFRRMRGQHVRVHADTDVLAKALEDAQAGGALTILGSTLPVSLAKRVLPIEHVDVLVLPWHREQFGEPEKVGNTLILVPGARGQYLGRLDLTLGENGRAVAWRHQVVSLPDSVPDSPRMELWYTDYTNVLKQDYARRVAREREAAGDSPYAGSQTCKGCHAHAYAIWKDSEHAHAFYSLQDVQKAFDANCIGCHTIGFGQTGGFIDSQTTGQLVDVGCEACHGPRKEHASSGGTKALSGTEPSPPVSCVLCHNRSHSPSFQYEEYWPRIRHGRETPVSSSQDR